MMKTYLLLFICLIHISISFSQKEKNKHVEITGSFIYLKYLGHHLDYGLNVSTYKDSSKFSNEIALYVSNIKAFKEYGVTIKQDYFTVGKAHTFVYKKFFFKSSLNTGLLFRDFRGVEGYQHELGLAFNPRLYSGFQYNKLKIGLLFNYTFNYTWLSNLNKYGENVNSHIWFPRNFSMSLNGYLSLTYSIK